MAPCKRHEREPRRSEHEPKHAVRQVRHRFKERVSSGQVGRVLAQRPGQRGGWLADLRAREKERRRVCALLAWGASEGTS